MLGSITPLGERGRGSRWGPTVAFYATGSVAGGLALGGLLGWAGWLASRASPAVLAAMGPWVLGVAVVVGASLDLGVFGGRLPGPERQVNEEWMYRYRGWVYGLGFGAQLGIGVVTIVTTSAVYCVFLAAFLSGTPGRGAMIGGTFGLVRALPVLSVWRVRDPGPVLEIDARLRRWAPVSRRAAVTVQIALAAALATAAVGWT
jgi:hypothetical protein